MTRTKSLLGKEGLDFNRDVLLWKESTILRLDEDRFKDIHLPQEDFADAAFDSQNEIEARQVFLLLSTPRSGSTAVCDYLFRKINLATHEYFQPYQYMPALASRWQCVVDGCLAPELYVQALLKNRVSKNGTLGVNLHGAHLGIFSYFERYLPPSLNMFALVLRRRKKVAQAVSYYIASNTKKWSSHFDTEKPIPEYSYDGIKRKLLSILHQELIIDLYIQEHAIPHQTIYYESISDGGSQLDKAVAQKLDLDEINIQQVGIKKQADAINVDYEKKFMKQLQSVSRKYARELELAQL
jgi:LPS sulfotransferase NodH